MVKLNHIIKKKLFILTKQCVKVLVEEQYSLILTLETVLDIVQFGGGGQQSRYACFLSVLTSTKHRQK